MKNLGVFLPICLAVTLLSCSNEGNSYTPYISVSHFLVNPTFVGDSISGAKDTLSMSLVNDCYVLDSINRTDTIIFYGGFGSLGNDLTAIRINYDSTQANFGAKITQKFQGIILPSSDLRHLQLDINPGYNFIAFPIGYRSIKEDNTFQFTLVVESDSKFSPRSVTFIQPVR